MKEFKLSTKTGKRIYDMGCHCCWFSLHNLYDTWSDAKERAYNWCYDQYRNDENSSAFGIGNANCFSFTASWLCTYKGEEVLRVETYRNSYIVFLNR